MPGDPEIFGSTAFLRGAEVVLGLQRLSDGYAKLHVFKHRDGGVAVGEQWGLLFDRERGFRRDPDDDKPTQTAADRVRDLLAAEPGLTEQQLIQQSGYKERTIRRALREVKAEAVRVGSTGAKQFVLPDPDAEIDVVDPRELSWEDGA